MRKILILFFISVDDLSDASQTRHVLYLGHRKKCLGNQALRLRGTLVCFKSLNLQSTIISIIGRKRFARK
jgi:hypothetical protein